MKSTHPHFAGCSESATSIRSNSRYEDKENTLISDSELLANRSEKPLGKTREVMEEWCPLWKNSYFCNDEL